MKKVRMIVSAAIVFAAVGGAFAFRPLNQGKIYCLPTGDQPLTSCNSSVRVDFEENSAGSETAPCAIFENTVPHVIVGTGANDCKNSSFSNFSPTQP